ncbi:hypothetical protein AN639_11465 [Candidatus Epulonipiscium fishelsonii]|uniref:Uncharacterized protein n=1 Tax=Candidatus Epulonipiscium fishelsonii TaxID=77094 RepID=A0ACC8X884_9FIRM|nr:hypothetical protein AN396_11545 [Epulopiscium sp. SCG-B11WGA-EpuloA1]ONI43066.1 hypothetical protein AN639_11465 [Epulopiscium sp. SCG-B05WGA-EpuloA1]
MEIYKYCFDKESKAPLFISMLSSKEDVIGIYNTFNKTNYSAEDLVSICVIDDAVYIRAKNDKYLMFKMAINLCKNQPAVNPNIPLQFLLQYAHLEDASIYAKRHPVKFVVFYNGITDMPEVRELRLSSAFDSSEESSFGGLELKVSVINITEGNNKEFLETSPILDGYAYLIDRVIHYGRENCTPKVAIEQAIQDCINNNKLKDYLEKNRNDVMNFLMAECEEQSLQD